MAVRIRFHGYQLRAPLIERGIQYGDLLDKLRKYYDVTGHEAWYQEEDDPEHGRIITYYVDVADVQEAVEFKLRWL